MMRGYIGMACLAIGLQVVVTTAHSATPADGDALDDFAWKWSVGQTRIFRLRLERAQETNAQRNYSTRILLDADLRIVASKHRPGETELTISFDRLRIENHAGQTHARFNSESKPSRADPSAWTIGGRALMDCAIVAWQSSSGKFKVVNGFGGCLDKALKGRTGVHPRDAFALGQVFGDAGFQQLMNSFFRVLPDSPLTTKKVWVYSDEIELGLDMDIVRTTRHEIIDFDADGQTASIKTVGHIASADDKRGPIRLPGGTAEVELLANSIDGRTLFSRARGALIEQRLDGALSIRTSLFDDTLPEGKSVVMARLMQKSILRLIHDSEAE